MRIKNIFKRCVAAALAAAIGMSTLATAASAAETGINIGYIWDDTVNPSISTKKKAVEGGVSGEYVKSGEQICRFTPSSGSDWAFCIQPSKSMQGTPSDTWYTQYGFTEYDTFDLTDKNKADSLAYWKKLGGTDGDMAKYLSLVQYYGYASHKNGNYFAATQLLIWELILGYRGHTKSTFGTCSDILWNDFSYPKDSWCSKSGVEKAYNSIVKNVKAHYNLPGALKSTKAQAKDEPALLLKYSSVNMRYQDSFKITSEYIDSTSLAHNFSTLESKLKALLQSKFSGTYGKDYGIEKSESDGVTTFTVWSKERPFTSASDGSIYVTDAVEMQLKKGLTKQESLFASSNYQTCLLSTKIVPVSGYLGIASYNEPNLIVEKTYTDSHNNAVTATDLDTLLGKTSFIIHTTVNGTKYYVVAGKSSDGSSYYFKK
ncbi:MAG: thioester domain-containing protein, partial [Ruminococcus sp.]|nr:thioester domain-containing protein [Ruminococcus sp.]